MFFAKTMSFWCIFGTLYNFSILFVAFFTIVFIALISLV
nr:MAG TPA: hypothetical protein [Caudoviricetes sp.]